MIERRFRQLREQLQGKKPHLPHFLSEILLRGIRGIDDVRVKFDYPVSVVAGGNASGKSTVLFAAACAYKVPDAGVRDFVPSTLFPDYRPQRGERADGKGEIVIEFDYSTPARVGADRAGHGSGRVSCPRRGDQEIRPARQLRLRPRRGPARRRHGAEDPGCRGARRRPGALSTGPRRSGGLSGEPARTEPGGAPNYASRRAPAAGKGS